MDSQEFLLLAQKVIRGAVGVGLEEAGTRICGPTAWKYVQAALSPVINELQNRYPRLFLMPEEAEKAAEALSEDKALLNMLNNGFTLLGKGQEEIKCELSKIESHLGKGQEEIKCELSKIESHLEDIAQAYMVTRGVIPYQDYLDGILTPEDLQDQETVHIDKLRKKLLRIKKFPKPIFVKVSGTLFPCALLMAGWWDRQEQNKCSEPKWHDDIQKWLFYGFDLWGPSWDFTWGEEMHMNNPYAIAQLGASDEADSIPVLVPQDKTLSLMEFFHENWGGGEVEIAGLLGHRRHFRSVQKEVMSVGGLLDYCIWIDPDNKDHGIAKLNYQTEIYSGYLWKCVTPKAWYDANRRLSLNQVYFIWEHTNFRDNDAVQYNLDSLIHKEEYLSKKIGDLVILQKSSRLVPGKPLWKSNEFYDVFVNKGKKKLI